MSKCANEQICKLSSLEVNILFYSLVLCKCAARTNATILTFAHSHIRPFSHLPILTFAHSQLDKSVKLLIKVDRFSARDVGII